MKQKIDFSSYELCLPTVMYQGYKGENISVQVKGKQPKGFKILKKF